MMKALKGKKTYLVAAILTFLNALIQHQTIAAILPDWVQVVTHEFIILMMVIMRIVTDGVTPEIKEKLQELDSLKNKLANAPMDLLKNNEIKDHIPSINSVKETFNDR